MLVNNNFIHICDKACNNQPCEDMKIADCFQLCSRNLLTYLMHNNNEHSYKYKSCSWFCRFSVCVFMFVCACVCIPCIIIQACMCYSPERFSVLFDWLIALPIRFSGPLFLTEGSSFCDSHVHRVPLWLSICITSSATVFLTLLLTTKAYYTHIL